MKIKLSDYVADFFVNKDIEQVFSVVGGGSMHLNDSFGHHPKLKSIYNHHEQACAMAADGYARVNNKPALICVTSGPGAVNALNGVIGAYQDSIPMIVVSGQVKSTMMVKTSGLNLRTLGGQEFDIVESLHNATKYAETVLDAKKIKYCLEKAYYLATSGRQGACWLDIPIDIQGLLIETDELESFNPSEIKFDVISENELCEKIDLVFNKLKSAERPVIYAGNGIRLSNSCNEFTELVNVLNVPVVTCWDSIDLIETNNRLYCGRAGLMGDRAGNFAVQNSDLLICIGTRLNVYQTGYNVTTWARGAFTVVVDIDSEELKKKILRADLPICASANSFVKGLLHSNNLEKFDFSNWIQKCNEWKTKYPVVQKKHYETKKNANVYAFMDVLSRMLPEKSVTVVSNGSASVVGSQSYYLAKISRFIMNCAFSSMGWGLPGAIGVCSANSYKTTICIEGDGSLMMNLQELQTVVTNKLPVKIFVINNQGYQQIRLTQNNIFKGRKHIGIGEESGDLGFPNFKKIAKAFGIPYIGIKNNRQLKQKTLKALNTKGFCLCEVFVTTDQVFEPKSATKKLSDGTLISPPLEDLAPFLTREELEANMIIPMI